MVVVFFDLDWLLRFCCLLLVVVWCLRCFCVSFEVLCSLVFCLVFCDGVLVFVFVDLVHICVVLFVFICIGIISCCIGAVGSLSCDGSGCLFLCHGVFSWKF